MCEVPSIPSTGDLGVKNILAEHQMRLFSQLDSFNKNKCDFKTLIETFSSLPYNEFKARIFYFSVRNPLNVTPTPCKWLHHSTTPSPSPSSSHPPITYHEQ